MFEIIILKFLRYFRLGWKCINAIVMIAKDEVTFFPRQVDKLEDLIRKYYGKDFYVITVANATLGLTSAYSLMKTVSNCKRAVVHPMVIPANYIGAIHSGYSVATIFLDPGTLNFDLDELEKNKADFDLVSVTHYFGLTCDMERLKNWCLSNDKVLIEDCSHAHGGKFMDQHLGTFGDIAVFSMQGSKFISGGEGAYILTRSKSHFVSLCKSFYQDKWRSRVSRQCKISDNEAETFELKCRMHPLSAALSLPDFQTMDLRNRLMNKVYKKLRKLKPSAFPIENDQQEIGGFCNGICIKSDDKYFLDKLRKNIFLRGIVYKRDYTDLSNHLGVQIKPDCIKQLLELNESCLYFTEKIFTSPIRYFALRMILRER